MSEPTIRQKSAIDMAESWAKGKDLETHDPYHLWQRRAVELSRWVRSLQAELERAQALIKADVAEHSHICARERERAEKAEQELAQARHELEVRERRIFGIEALRLDAVSERDAALQREAEAKEARDSQQRIAIRVMEQLAEKDRQIAALREALELVRRTIRNSRRAPNVLDTLDYVAERALAAPVSPAVGDVERCPNCREPLVITRATGSVVTNASCPACKWEWTNDEL